MTAGREFNKTQWPRQWPCSLLHGVKSVKRRRDGNELWLLRCGQWENTWQRAALLAMCDEVSAHFRNAFTVTRVAAELRT